MDIIHDYQGEINKYLKYGKKKDPMDLGADPAGPMDSLGEAVFGMDDWKKYRAGNNADTQKAEERETPEPPPTQAPVAPVDTPPEKQPEPLNTSLWEKASKSPNSFSLYGDDEQKLTVDEKRFLKSEAEDSVREHEKTLSSTDDPLGSYRADTNKRYRLDDLYRDVTEHKKNFWHSTPKDQVVFNQKLQKYKAALEAADRDMELYLSTRPQGAAPRADDMFQTTTIRDPETGKDMVTKVYRSGRTEVIGQSPTDELAGRRSASEPVIPKSSIFFDRESGASGYVQGGKFNPVENPLSAAGPAQDGTIANNYLGDTDPEPPPRATPRTAAEPKPKADPLDKEIAAAERDLNKAVIDAQEMPRTANKKDRDTAETKVRRARAYLDSLRAKKGGTQPGAPPPAAGGKPIATGKTKSGNSYALVD